MTINKPILELIKIKNKKEKLQAEIKKLNEKEEYLEGLIISEMRKEGLTQIKMPQATAFIKTESYPNIDSWEEVLHYILKNKTYNLLKKGIAPAIWRSYKDEEEILIPGTSSFDKISLLIRRTTK